MEILIKLIVYEVLKIPPHVFLEPTSDAGNLLWAECRVVIPAHFFEGIFDGTCSSIIVASD